MNIQLLIPAAGLGTRLGVNQPKALVDLAGQPLLVRTLGRFRDTGLVENAVIVFSPGFEAQFGDILGAAFLGVRWTLVAGGAERQESVQNGLNALAPETEIVVIHDAARPFISMEAVQTSIKDAAEFGAATVAIPSIDTVLQGDAGGFLVDTPDRRYLWACQTPQTFRVGVIRRAHAEARRENYTGTDDASLVRRLGGTVKLVTGSPLNFKVTTPMDFALAQCVIREGMI